MSTEKKAFLLRLAKAALLGACVAVALYFLRRAGWL
jgi:hypothetical protein